MYLSQIKVFSEFCCKSYKQCYSNPAGFVLINRNEGNLLVFGMARPSKYEETYKYEPLMQIFAKLIKILNSNLFVNVHAVYEYKQ